MRSPHGPRKTAANGPDKVKLLDKQIVVSGQNILDKEYKFH